MVRHLTLLRLFWRARITGMTKIVRRVGVGDGGLAGGAPRPANVIAEIIFEIFLNEYRVPIHTDTVIVMSNTTGRYDNA